MIKATEQGYRNYIMRQLEGVSEGYTLDELRDMIRLHFGLTLTWKQDVAKVAEDLYYEGELMVDRDLDGFEAPRLSIAPKIGGYIPQKKS